MEGFRFGIYMSVIFFVSFHFELVTAVKQTSAVILQVQSVPNGVSSAKLIECAFHLMKSSDSSFVRIAEGSNVCEQLARPSSTSSNFFEKGFEYLEKSTLYNVFNEEDSFNEGIAHYIYKEVNIGDKFDFVFHMSKSDKLTVSFRNMAKTDVALRLNDNSTHLRLITIEDSITIERKTLASPFKDCQIYKISFEVLEHHWKITINGEVLTTFDHHGLITYIEMIRIKLGPSVNYLSKYFNPKTLVFSDHVW
ncbi:uncharacterized protein LOC132712836 [Ruditapes philippinarum]|uniref:uncharacterized protein LOC132712836 n=1 Tax=Ruditapes philippinarum TaxID=129788 RepID=UPI00295B2F98|nr:uncharacterized protein LOC132712836 [Ruditapes philippinarum]